MDLMNRIRQSEQMKEKGTEFFKAGKYQDALHCYKRVVDLLASVWPTHEVFGEKCQSLRLAGHLNCALCHLKLSEDREALMTANKALEIEPSNEKGLYRRGAAHMNLQDYPAAQEDFTKVLEINPSNTAARQHLEKVEKILPKHSIFGNKKRWIIWASVSAILWAVSIRYGFWEVYLIVFLIVWLYFVCTSTRPRAWNEPSAYSVFNPNCQRIDGTLTMQDFEKEIRYGPGSML